MKKTTTFDPNRRDFLKVSAALAAASLLPSVIGSPERLLAQDKPATDDADKIPGKGKAKHLIILSLRGGPSHIDTFDPKTDSDVAGEFKSIGTAMKDIRFTEIFPKLAECAADLCVINSMTSKEGNHDRARYLTHTGHIPNPTVSHPSLGSILAKELGKEDFDLPHFVAIGAAAQGGGYIGPIYSPMIVNNPDEGLSNIDYGAGMDKDRMAKRMKLREDVDKEFKKTRNEDIPNAQKAMYEKAKRMMDSKNIVAFDLSKEPKESRDAYGRNQFGQGVLMARRLLEVGVTSVEVTLNGWDTHNDGFTTMRNLGAGLDVAFAQLIKDLKRLKLFDSTVIACHGEFGRSPNITSDGGRGHFPRAWSTVLAGGPFVRGKKIGSTDKQGDKVVERPVEVPDFFRSMAHAFGFDAFKEFEINDRPTWYVDKKGKVIPELFA
ncbi:MAG: DUF1501 domain-containing protein [Planctomycetaceae bacterium]|nr:DUF1501 domain-containing protein [Planctomycetaceae bacterium]